MSQVRSELRKLCELQRVDDELNAAIDSLKQVESLLGKAEELEQTRKALEEEQQKLAAIKAAQNPVEAEMQDLSSKIGKLEERLFEGGKGSKELTAIQQEIETEKARRKVLEEKGLELLSQVEAVQGRIEDASQRLKIREKDWTAEQADLEQRQAQLKREMGVLQEKRSHAAAPISSEILSTYETVRASRDQAVARVERGMCKGCRLILPVSEWQRVRTGALVRCSSCGRILCLD